MKPASWPHVPRVQATPGKPVLKRKKGKCFVKGGPQGSDKTGQCNDNGDLAVEYSLEKSTKAHGILEDPGDTCARLRIYTNQMAVKNQPKAGLNFFLPIERCCF